MFHLFLTALAFAFALIPFSQAKSHIHSHHSHLNTVRRHQQDLTHVRRNTLGPLTIPANWTSQGCYTDNPGSRTLTAAGFASALHMSTESCLIYCTEKSFIYAGTEFGSECYCDNFINLGGEKASDADCNVPCSGNEHQSCGAASRLNMYWNGQTPPPPPTIVPSVGNWTSLGCYSEGTTGRALAVGMNVPGPLTVELCTSACFTAGYPLSGQEYSAECYCGATVVNGGAPTVASGCNMHCSGNFSQFCGGPGTLTLYNYTGTDLPPTPAPPPPNGPPATPVFPVLTDLPGTWNYSGCWVDNSVGGRALEVAVPGNDNLTVQACIETCNGLNYTVAGAEYSTQCFCGNRLVNGAAAAQENTCNMGCGGNSTEACGGPDRLSIYSSAHNFTVLPAPVIKKTGLPGKWKYSGCLREPPTARAFPYFNEYATNNTVEGCLNQCASFGYPAAGLEFSQQCWCGDVEDITTNQATAGEEGECNMFCTGDPTQLCGGAQRLLYYTWDGGMNTWHKPTNIGRYEFFMPGLIVPLIATLGINNKVTFLEKGGTGMANASSGYELDLTLVSTNSSAAWRDMNVNTDVFCSASLILPDKAGRQINIGGWSFDSTFGVRMYTPSGTAGVNGTTDWEENPAALHLQRGRWYPSAVLMSNGSILVVGGETGSNAEAQPNLELLPKPPGGSTVLEMDWLKRTDPNNLYPFLFVLPSGNIFVGYYNEARILDQKTFKTLVELPNIPGSVNNFEGGRTYPLEGTAMSLPQYAPYTDPLRILICGGSGTVGRDVLDNCVTIAPEEPNPTWTLERMPSKRVMPCMVALPDGTFMIMNGAKEGVAGFGLAKYPNLDAVLYDPAQPVGSRFSTLNSTVVARMYHSEAILLPDGRILISGSDPENLVELLPFYPQEYRVEVYYPPYLTDGRTQPEYNITNTDWAYGSKNDITVKLFHGKASNMRVSLLAATSSTHGNTMGGRTIFPKFTCNSASSGIKCTITAPPNSKVSPPGWHMLFILDGPTPSHSQWVRIGGDPSQLGKWPELPGFRVPGV